ncbi:MAG: FitA-like ribbon-helix-helix domain-containing protein [Geminicoccales bacterium]
MAQLLVRNLDEDLVRRLKLRAAAAGRSAEAEHRLILEQALEPDVAAFKERARQLRERTKGRSTVDSADIIREFRDRDNPHVGD